MELFLKNWLDDLVTTFIHAYQGIVFIFMSLLLGSGHFHKTLCASLSLGEKTNIKFILDDFKLEKSTTEVYEMSKTAYEYDNNAVSRSQVFEWFSRFQVGKDSIKENVRSGRPC